MTQSQKEFEAWASQYEYDLSWDKFIDGYAIMHTRVVWDTWQASRAALVVELPATCCRTLIFELEGITAVGMEHDEYFEVDEIKMALDSAGVKYK